MIHRNLGCLIWGDRRLEVDHPNKLSSAAVKRERPESTVCRILLKEIADSVRPSGSQLAHLYGLLKINKEYLAMRPILSATQTCNYGLAKWLQPLTYNQYTTMDTFDFANEIYRMQILVSYDVSWLLYLPTLPVPLEETIQILFTR